MIQVGLVGVGPLWEQYHPVLSRLRQPIHVEAVYDPVFARADRAAKALDADAVPGICALAARGNVDAILVMDPAWTGTSVLSLLTRQEKPVFCAPWLMDDSASRNTLTGALSNSDVLIVPAMWKRFLPSAIRLQELIATEIGQPREIVIDLTEHDETHPTTGLSLESIVGWLDFGRNLFRAFPVSASCKDFNGNIELRINYPPTVAITSEDRPSTGTGSDSFQERTARLTFGHIPHESNETAERSEPAASTNVKAKLNQRLFDRGTLPVQATAASEAHPPAQPPVPQIKVRCDRGTATVNSETQIHWQSETAEPVQETLTSERTKEEIMLDIFCRRVIGGLVPVADLNDILKPIQLLQSCLET